MTNKLPELVVDDVTIKKVGYFPQPHNNRRTKTIPHKATGHGYGYTTKTTWS